MGTVRYSENLKLAKQTTRRHKPEDNNNSRPPVVCGTQECRYSGDIRTQHNHVLKIRTRSTPYSTILNVVAVVSSETSANFVQTPRLRVAKHCSVHSARFEEVGLVRWAKADESGPQSFLATQTGDVDRWRCCVVGVFCLLLVLGYSTADFSSRAAWHDDEMTGGGRWGGGEMRHVLFLKVQSTSESEKRDGRRDGQNYVTCAGTVCQ